MQGLKEYMPKTVKYNGSGGVLFLRSRDKESERLEPKKETRTDAEIWGHVSGLLYPGRSLGGSAYLEGAGGPIRIIPTGSDSKRLTDAGIDLSKVSENEANNIYNFLEKANCMEEMVMVLHNAGSGEKRMIMPKEGSRYFAPGRFRLKLKINRKMQKPKYPGRMITLTYDPVKISRESAWRNAGKHLSAFMDTVKVWLRRKKGITKVQYFWVVEEQKGTGYPHFHVFIQDETASPNRKDDFKGSAFIPWILLLRWWGLGGVRIQFCRASIRHYITKYIGKVAGMSLNAMAHMWANKRRLYGFSRDYLVKLPDREKQAYELVGMFHPVKGFGVKTGGEYFWAGNVPIDWLVDRIENPESMGHIKLKQKLWEGGRGC